MCDENILTYIQIFCSIVSLIVACYIPEKIKWEQMYSSLISEYRSYDFAIAVQGLIEFFVLDCDANTSKIKGKYKERFIKEIYDLKTSVSTIGEVKKQKNNINLLQKDSDKILHFQRRLLTQFYNDLDTCLKTPIISSHRILKDFTKSEAKIIHILYLINESMDSDEILYKDISCDEKLHETKRTKTINRNLKHLCSKLKN